MPETLVGLNPTLLVWARTNLGYTTEEVAEKLGQSVTTIQKWEAGETTPTYVQLETLAYNVYHRPVAVFFFPEPPSEPDPEGSFRTLPEVDSGVLSPDTRMKIRDAMALKDSLHQLCMGRNPASRLIWTEVIADPSRSPDEAADAARRVLGVSLTEQKRWRSARKALTEWRTLLVSCGVNVFKNTFKQREVSGFCLSDEVFPIIYVNNSTTFTRQVFTVAHELAHVLLKTNGITRVVDPRILSWEDNGREVEVFCNKFAAEFLMPQSDFSAQLDRGSIPQEMISSLARAYSVSREVVLRRLFDMGRVNREQYDSLTRAWEEQRKRDNSKVSTGGGNYYRTQLAYLGGSFTELAFRSLYSGRIDQQQLANHLRMKPKNLKGLERLLVSRS